jgi:hypothetical protein
MPFVDLFREITTIYTDIVETTTLPQSRPWFHTFILLQSFHHFFSFRARSVGILHIDCWSLAAFEPPWHNKLLDLKMDKFESFCADEMAVTVIATKLSLGSRKAHLLLYFCRSVTVVQCSVTSRMLANAPSLLLMIPVQRNTND